MTRPFGREDEDLVLLEVGLQVLHELGGVAASRCCQSMIRFSQAMSSAGDPSL